MDTFYTPAQRAAQARFQTENLANLLKDAIVHAEITDAERVFIESRDLFFLATVDSAGNPACSYKGGDPGFVRVLDPRTLAFPIYDGNGMYVSVGNVQATSKVALLFIDFETPNRLRVQGSASILDSDPLLASFPGADAIVRVAVSTLFVNCSRYIHRYQRTAASRYVPRGGCQTPFAEWKRIDIIQDALPPRDLGKTVESGGTITVEEYEAKLAAGEA